MLNKIQLTCIVEDCKLNCYGNQVYCSKHYKRWYRHGDPNIVLHAWTKNPKKCLINKCVNVPRSLGLCEKHYYQKYRLENRYQTWAESTLSDHKRSGFVISITKRELIGIAEKSKLCYLCELPLLWCESDKMLLFTNLPILSDKILKGWFPSLDRIYNENELRHDNIAICHLKCNIAKGTQTLNEFLDFCQLVINRASAIKNKYKRIGL